MFSQQVKALMGIFNGLLLENHIPQKLDRTWTQEPVVLEDAFLRVFPVHLEFINTCKFGVAQHDRKLNVSQGKLSPLFSPAISKVPQVKRR